MPSWPTRDLYAKDPGLSGRSRMVEPSKAGIRLSRDAAIIKGMFARGDRQMVKILSAVLSDGLAAVEAACAETLASGVHSAEVVLNALARRREPAPAATVLTPYALRLRHAPVADCAR